MPTSRDHHVWLGTPGIHVPMVSVGMPVYNGERSVAAALESLLVQDFADFELIISDNASTDGTEAICREFAQKDPRIRYVRHPGNRGTARNFKFVLDEARAPYFMWAAHDDRWMPGYVAATLEVLRQHPDAVCAVSRVMFSHGHLSDATSALIGSPRDRLRNWLMAHPGDNSRVYGLYRTDTLRRCFPGRTWEHFAGDWILVGAAALEGDTLEVPEVLMEREVAEKGRYFSSLSRQSLLVSSFPLLPFTVAMLKHKEVWTAGSLRRLLALNVRYHVDMAAHCGWFVYPGYRAVSRAIRTLRGIVPANHGSGGPA